MYQEKVVKKEKVHLGKVKYLLVISRKKREKNERSKNIILYQRRLYFFLFVEIPQCNSSCGFMKCDLFWHVWVSFFSAIILCGAYLQDYQFLIGVIFSFVSIFSPFFLILIYLLSRGRGVVYMHANNSCLLDY